MTRGTSAYVPPVPSAGPPAESHPKVDGSAVIDVTEGEKNGEEG